MRRRPLARFALLAAAGCCAAVTCTAVAQAAGEDQRRLAAELVVIGGDLRRLRAGDGGPLERAGLEKRLAGALASLPLLLRRAGGDPAPVAPMRAALAGKAWRALGVTLAEVGRRHPFDATQLLPPRPADAATREAGAAIHRAACAGCHEADGADGALPAKRLATWIRAMPREEFAARLWLGVRGDRMTGWRNPFSDPELAALIAFYETPP